MTHLQLDIARKAFIRIREVKFVELLNRIEMERRVGSVGEEGLLLGDILAFQGKYQEAAKCFVKFGQEQRAIEMFCDMKMWEQARLVCTQEDHLKDLIRRQARWAEETGDTEEAANLWLAAGDFPKAIRMYGESGSVDKLREISRTVPKSDTQALQDCIGYFRKHGAFQYAAEIAERIGDNRARLQLLVQMGMWDDAFKLVDKFPQYAGEVYVPWAGWLATNDRFEEAQEAFRLAHRPREAKRMMEQLGGNAVITKKFADAAYYFVKLAQECGALEDGEKRPTEDEWGVRTHRFFDFSRKADIYFAYSLIHKYATQPFTSADVLHLYNASRFLASELSDPNFDVPFNVSKLDVLLSLGRLTASMDMNRMARHVYEKLQQYVLPPAIMEQLDVATLIMRGRPYQDKDEHLSICYRCGQTLASLQSPGDRCPHCAHRFVRSFHSFEPLPLVEFVLAADVSDDQAVQILTSGAGKKPKVEDWERQQQRNNNGAGVNGAADVITFNDELVDAAMNPHGGGPGGNKDPFVAQMMQIELQGRGAKEYIPIVLDAEMIKNLRSNEVFIVRPGNGTLPIHNRYYRNMVPSVAITLCENCNHFFHADDFEFCCMRGKGCPVCRHKKGSGHVGANDSVLESPVKVGRR